MDADLAQKTPTVESDNGRKALGSKEFGIARGSILKPKTGENALGPALSQNSTPRSRFDRKPISNVFSDEREEPVFQPHPETSVFSAVEEPENTGINASQPAKFTPFSNAQPFRVFSQPAEDENEIPPPPPRSVGFKPFIDSENAAPPRRQILGERPPLRAFAPEEAEVHEHEEDSIIDYDESEAYESHEELEQNASVDPAEMEYGYEDESHTDLRAHRTPLGGRFGQFNVMTPITERTFEYTSTSRTSAFAEHTGPVDKGFVQSLAIENAERLAAELREEEENTRNTGRSVFQAHAPSPQEEYGDIDEHSHLGSFDEPRPRPFRVSDGHTISVGMLQSAGLGASSSMYIEERTETLSLSDSLALVSSFKPPNPCNPFDPQIIATLLSLLPADQDPAYFNFPRQEIGLLEGLQKFGRKNARRTSGNTSSRSADGPHYFPVNLGQQRFQVYEKVGEGGFGAVFAAKDVTSKPEPDGSNDDDDDLDDEDEDEDEEGKNRVALKVVKPRNLWEFHVLRKVHKTLPERLRTSIIQPRALHAFKDESFLVLDLCTQGTLLEIINRANTAGISQQGACLDELLVAFFTIELLRLIEGLHAAGFIHGDLKIDNCLLRLDAVPGAGVAAWSGTYDPAGAGGWAHKGIRLIDFGRAIDARMFPPGQTFVAEWPTDARDCAEMRAGRPWTYQADYFGLAGIVYCMLYGKYIEAASVAPVPGAPPGTCRLATPFKRYWQTDLWTRLFDVLLNPCAVHPDGRLPVPDALARVRVDLEAWLQANCNRSSNTLKGLLKKVELAVMRGE